MFLEGDLMSVEKALLALRDIINDENIYINEPMCKHTSFRIGGAADLLIDAHSFDDIENTVRICKQFDVNLFVMGNGTNLLVRDNGIRGIVLKINKGLSEIRWINNRVNAQAGVSLSKLSRQSIAHGFTGLEFACGIPGTVGGAVMMNAGAYRGEIADCLVKVRYLNSDGEINQRMVKKDDLSYRKSIFSQMESIVLDAEFELAKDEDNRAEKLANEITAKRNAKQPVNIPSAGSTFKRPTDGYAAQMIEQAGLKGLRVNGAQVSTLHSGFVVNTGGATADDVLTLVNLIKQRVKEAFDVELELEIKVIGE